jgi:glyoxylase-like metal-dependent hydrolase (beta-lactamase superfamily II)
MVSTSAVAALKPLALGRFRIDRVTESVGPFADLHFILPQADLRAVNRAGGWLRPDYVDADNRLVMSFHSYVLRTEHHCILVDACVGNDKERPLRPGWHRQRFGYLEALTAAGLTPDDIDFVCCTHLHADHVGWNTCLRDGRWVPTFPRARYVFADREYRHWETAHRDALARGVPLPNHGSFADSVLPVVEAGQAIMVGDSHEFEAGVWLQAAPGHTPGNAVIHVRSEGERGLFSGDILHTPVQLLNPDWSSRFCDDPLEAAGVRRALVQEIADSGAWMMAGHFPGSVAGRIVSDAAGWRWQAGAV